MAQVRIDGLLLQPNLTGVEVAAGDHVVVVELPGYTAHQEEISLAGGGRHSVQATLRRNSAVLTFFTSPAGATIELDGNAEGRTEPVDTGLGSARGGLIVEGVAVGHHEMRVSLDGYRPVTRTLQVAELRDYNVPEVPLEPTRGSLRVNGLPDDATLTLNGEGVDAAGRVDGSQTFELPPGAYTL